MDDVFNHVNNNWRFYTVLIVLLGAAALFWLSKYFATKKDLQEHAKQFDIHKLKFDAHQEQHYRLRDEVIEIKNHVKHLPTAEESASLREEMARLNGRLEGMEPLFKQVLNNVNLLVENELRGEKK